MFEKIKNMFKKPKLRVAVLMGGPSSEHDVSLWTGKMVVSQLDKNKYEVTPITISKDRKWPTKVKDISNNFDLSFIAMHGEYGEDGTLQKLLEKHKIPYTRSTSKASRLAMDKAKFIETLRQKKINCPDSITVSRNSLKNNWLKLENFGLPLVVKPSGLGSSVGVNIVKSWGQLAPAIKTALSHDSKILVEKYIEGKELTCGALEVKGTLMALPPTEIIPKNRKFFDYKAKYTPKASLEITPPRLPENTIKEIQQTALKVYKAAGCSSYARTDMILGKDGKLYVLEINTLPGMTKTSLLPQAAKKAGFSFPQLLDIIIDNARN